jgi:hypothetical protein
MYAIFRGSKEDSDVHASYSTIQLGVPFEIMCDASNYAIGAVLRQRVDKLPHVIYYASRTLNDAQLNYSTT